MKMSTPHDKPTHMLENPEQYITKSGKFIRSHSLDALVQMIFENDFDLYYKDIKGYSWTEVDTVDDLIKAREVQKQ